MDQEIHFCTAPDGVRVAYATVGEGPPFVKTANWLNHLEADWKSPIWRHFLDEFSKDQALVRYDERGNGLSDWSVESLTLDDFVNDLDSVVNALGLERFPLLGISQGGAVAIEYTVRNPDKVSHLILFGAFSRGWRKLNIPPHVAAKREAQLALITHGWGKDNPATRQFFTTTVIPDATPMEAASFNELQLLSTSAKNAARLFEAFGNLDVWSRLPQVSVPAIVFHSRNDALIGFEDGRRIAASIPGAKFVPLESNNHILLSHEPAWAVFVDEVRRFIGRSGQPSKQPGELSQLMTCPRCKRKYTDGGMNFCLDDGSRLVDSNAPASGVGLESEPTRIIDD